MKERLAKWEEYEAGKNLLELFVDDIRLKLRDAGAQCEPVTDAAELVRQRLLSARELSAAVECRRTDLDRLQQTSVVLADTASEARQIALRHEITTLIDAVVELTEMLTRHITRLEVLDQHWTELGTQSSELKTLLAEKQETLQQTVNDTSLTPDQQYAAVKVRVFFS